MTTIKKAIILIILVTNWYSCSTIKDIDGNKYKTVKIGEQDWMAENLRVTRYNNGDSISNGEKIGDYSDEIEPEYMFVYNDNASYANTYGRLYTWIVTIDERNVCPTGWHVPNDKEWTELELFLGLSILDTAKICDLNNNISGILKSKSNTWLSPNLGATNESKFSAMPAGYRRRYNFDKLGKFACFWSSSSHDYKNSWYRHLYNDKEGVCRTYNLKNYGFSVRCIKDKK
jgi:uncharacterized protein (TIGR02145 family)